MGVVVAYYMFMFAYLIAKRLWGSKVTDQGYRPFFFIIIPAHNEEAVIAHTIESLLRQDYKHKAIMVMNDGSKDDTSRIAHEYADKYEDVVVVDRGPDIAGRGKGQVLNHAYGLIIDMVANGWENLEGRGAEDVLIAITDADGQLEKHTLASVAAYFANPVVGGVQIGVRIANANTNVLTRMQDMEFIGFSAFVQEARDSFGSVGLGGNGQFTRLDALLDLGCVPWTDCLTEDLDLGLSMVKKGWRVRFCPQAYVAQQAVEKLHPLFRQRTRWIQGHYQCWSHLPDLIKQTRIPLHTRLDLSLYLLLVVFVVLVSVGMVFSIMSIFGVITVESTFLNWVPSGVPRNLVSFLLSFGPMSVFVITYQMRSPTPLPGRWIPAYAMIFALYTYAWLVATLWAWSRMIARRGEWAKTARVASKAAV